MRRKLHNRRNAPEVIEVGELSPEDFVLSPLPDGDWKECTVEKWETWRRDPVTKSYSAAEVNYAEETIRLIDSHTGVKAMTEARHRMTDLGLTDQGKIRRGLRVKSEPRATTGRKLSPAMWAARKRLTDPAHWQEQGLEEAMRADPAAPEPWHFNL